ncbi:MAG TPA: hypothetical protein VH989_11895 [Actinomycetota bacterium]|jgi:hypothetical protein
MFHYGLDKELGLARAEDLRRIARGGRKGGTRRPRPKGAVAGR